MRVKIEGQITKARVLEVLDDILSRDPCAEQLTGFNMYFTLRDGQGTLIEFLNDQEEPIEVLLYREARHQTPIKPKAPKKRKPQLSVVKSAA